MKKAVRIAVSNVSGGEGKTTLAREIAFTLAGRGFRVALFDLDPQASLSKGLGLYEHIQTVVDVFRKDAGTELPEPVNVRGVDVWPTDDSLGEAEAILMNDFSRVENLRLAIDRLLAKTPYDYVVLDCKPQRTSFLAASLAAADHLVLPVSGLKGVENIDQIAKLLKAVKPYSPHLNVRLIVPNRIKGQTRHHRNLLAFLAKEYQGVAPISRPVRDSTAVVGAASEYRECVVQHDPQSDIAQDFQGVTDDLLAAIGGAV